MKKITLATFKKFVRENSDKLFINVKSSFDGMTDCVMSCDNGFTPLKKDNKDDSIDYTLGYIGIWLVGQSRDRFKVFENEIFKGIEVYNSCGSYIVALKKGGQSNE